MNKRIMKVITLILSCLLLIGAAVGLTAAAEEVNNTPTVEIVKKNVAYEGAIQLVYLVDTNVEDGTVYISFSDGENTYEKKAAGTITLSGVEYASVYSDGIVAKNYRKTLTATPLVKDAEGNTVATGAAVEFSAYDYAMARFDGNYSENQFNLYKALLDYGAAVQTVLGYNDETVTALGGWIDEYYNTTITNEATGEVLTYKRGKTAPDANFIADRFADGKVFLGLYEGEELATANAGWYKYTVKPGTAEKNIVAKFADGTNPYEQFNGTENPSFVTYHIGSFVANPTTEVRYATMADGAMNFVQDNAADGQALKVHWNAHTTQVEKIVYDFDMRVEYANSLRTQFLYLKYYSTNSAGPEVPYTGSALQFQDTNESDNVFEISGVGIFNYNEWINIRLEFVKAPGEYGFRVYKYFNGVLDQDPVKEGNEVVGYVDYTVIDGHSSPYLHFETRYNQATAAKSNVSYSIDNFRIDESAACTEHEYADIAGSYFKVSDATCSAPKTFKKSCNLCGAVGTETFTVGETVDHSYSEVTCTAHPTCTVCGVVDESVELLPHNFAKVPYAYAVKTQATNNSPATYYESCNVCKSINEEVTFVFGKTEPYYGGTGNPDANGLGVTSISTDTSAALGWFLLEENGNWFVRYHDDSTGQSTHDFYNKSGVTDASVYYYQTDIRIDGFSNVRDSNWPVTIKLMGVKKDTTSMAEVDTRAFDIFAYEGDTHAAITGGGNSNAADNYEFGTWATLTFKIVKGEADGDAFKWTVTMYVDGISTSTRNVTSKVIPQVRMEPRYSGGGYKSACNIDYDNIITYYEHTCNEDGTVQGDAYLVTAGDCATQTNNVYNKSCTVCGAKGTATFESGYSHAQYIEQVDAQYLKAAADCANLAEYYTSCAVCGIAHETETFFAGELADHVYIHRNSQANLKTAATATTPAEYWVTCKGCGETNGDTFTDGALIHDYSEGTLPSYYSSTLTTSGESGAYRIIMEDNGNMFFRLGKDASSGSENIAYWIVPTDDYVLSNSLWFDFKWNGGVVNGTSGAAGYVKVYAADGSSGYINTALNSSGDNKDLSLFGTTFVVGAWYRINVQFNYNNVGGTTVLIDVYNAAGELVKDNFSLGNPGVRTAMITIHPRGGWRSISWDIDNAYLVTEHICEDNLSGSLNNANLKGETATGAEFYKSCNACGRVVGETDTVENAGVYTVGAKPAIPSMSMTGAATAAPEADANEDGIGDGVYWLAQSETITNIKGEEVENTFLRYVKNNATGGVQWTFAPAHEDGKNTYVVEFDIRWQGAQNVDDPAVASGSYQYIYNFAVGGKKGFYGTSTTDGNSITLHSVSMNKGDWHKITYVYIWNETNQNYDITIKVDGNAKSTTVGTSIGLAWEMRWGAAFSFMFDVDNFTYTAK